MRRPHAKPEVSSTAPQRTVFRKLLDFFSFHLHCDRRAISLSSFSFPKISRAQSGPPRRAKAARAWLGNCRIQQFSTLATAEPPLRPPAVVGVDLVGRAPCSTAVSLHDSYLAGSRHGISNVLAPAQGGVAHARSIRRTGRRRCVGSDRRQRAHAAASRAFRPAAGLPPQRRCGSGWSRSGSTGHVWPPWPQSAVPTARESVLPPSPGAACAYGRPARR